MHQKNLAAMRTEETYLDPTQLIAFGLGDELVPESIGRF